MKVTHMLPILFQGFYAESQCSKAIIGTVEKIKEMNQVFKSRGFYTQDDERTLVLMIKTYDNFVDEKYTRWFQMDNPETTVEERADYVHDAYFCDPDEFNNFFIEFEKWIRKIWENLVKRFDLLDLEETKNLIREGNKVLTAFVNFGYGNLYVDPQLRTAFRKIFGENMDIKNRVITVYESFKSWQTFHSDEESAKMFQVLLSATIDELKPLAKSIEKFVWAFEERVWNVYNRINRANINRQRRKVSNEVSDFSNEVSVYADNLLTSFITESMSMYEFMDWTSEFIGDLEDKNHNDLKSMMEDILESKNKRRFHEIAFDIKITNAQVKSYWIKNCPIVSTHLDNLQLEDALDDVRKVINSTEVKNLLKTILAFPRAFWDEFDINEFVQINKILLAQAKLTYRNIDGLN